MTIVHEGMVLHAALVAVSSSAEAAIGRCVAAMSSGDVVGDVGSENVVEPVRLDVQVGPGAAVREREGDGFEGRAELAAGELGGQLGGALAGRG